MDAHNVVPIWEASDKREHAARTLRPKINALLPEFLTEYPALPIGDLPSWPSTPPPIDWDRILHNVLQRKNEVREITALESGEDAAKEALKAFLKPERLSLYATKRNDPTVPQAQSNLSPYLHFGFLAPQRAALDAKKHETRFKYFIVL